MEKKNTILLTIIAVATLLVGVVGATFAYFTATVNTKNEENSTTNIKTSTLVSASMDFGSLVTSNNALPGYKALKTVTVKGAGNAGDQPVSANITLTPNVTGFGSHVKYSLYRIATKDIATKGVTCTESKPVAGTKAYDEMTCNTTNAGTPIASGTFNGTTPVSTKVNVAYNDDDTYYLVVEYENEVSSDQNSEQGQTFSVAIDFAAQA